MTIRSGDGGTRVDRLVVVILGLSSAIGANAQGFNADWSDLSEVMDRSIQDRMREGGVAGAVVTIVRDGEIAYNGAFGEAAPGVPASHAGTLFRVASLTKTFTALAAAQLAERGVLDLDADIAGYLGDEAPPTPLGGASMRQLLTHTSGFDNSEVGDAARDADGVVSLQAFVAERLTRQTSRPGEVFKYSNHGYTLAGRVIEVVSGERYADHVRENLLVPLEMDSSSLEQPAPAGLEDRLAVGCVAYSHEPLPRDYSQVVPADGLVTTGADMGRYLLLHTGWLEGAGVLSDLSLAHTHAFGHTKSAPTMALGWEEYSWAGRRALTHTGGQLGFTSFAGFLPDEGIGVFIAMNTRASNARVGVLMDFLSAFVTPKDTGWSAPTTVAAPHAAADYVGRYLSLDRAGGFERWLARLGLTARIVEVTDHEGRVAVERSLLVESAPDRFDSPHRSAEVWRFERDASGNVTYALTGRDAFRRLAFYETPETIANLLLVGLATAAARGLIVPIVGFAWRRRAVGSWAVTMACLALTAGAALTVAALSAAPKLDYGLPLALRVGILANGVAVALFAAAAALLLANRPRLGPRPRLLEGATLLLVLPYAALMVGLGLAGWA